MAFTAEALGTTGYTSEFHFELVSGIVCCISRHVASTILNIEFTDWPQRRVAHLRNQMGQVWSGAVSAPASSSVVTLMPARNAAGSSHSSQHAGIFSIRPFSAPPSDGQIPVTFPAEELPKQQAQKLTFLNAAHIPHRPARAGGVEMTPPFFPPGVTPL